MGEIVFMIKFFIGLFFLSIAILIGRLQFLSRTAPLPELSDTEYWGPGSGANYKENTAVKPFDISVKPEVIEDLKAQLSRPLELHEPLEDIGFQYGFNSKYLEKVVTYWRDNYLPKWNERVEFLKQFPHFETEIQGLRIHFIHVKPKMTEGKKVFPLLLLHGWPGSIREFYRFIPMLTKPDPKSDYIFEVIVPSLPGYGWSQGASKVNFGPAQVAIVLRNLMLRLGHQKFFIQGGDWGSIIGSNIATLRPQNVIGYHSNLCTNMNHQLAIFYKFWRIWFPRLFISNEHKDFFKPFGKEFSFIIEESGYLHIQATKPDTIGAALLNNPVGLAAYILEKFSTWTNPDFKKLEDGGLTKHFTLDGLLDNIMIYYTTKSITTSQRLYSEAFNNAQYDLNLDTVHTSVSTGCARFINDLTHSTDLELETKYKNLTQSTYHRKGGHFAAMEVPELLHEDFLLYVNKVLAAS